MKTNFKKFGLQIGALALAFGIFASASPQALAASSISSSKAKSIALSNAKLKSSQVTFTKVKSDREDGVNVWDVEFKTSTKKYEYEIRKSDGRILDKDVETIRSKKQTSSKKSTSTSSNITRAKAKSIALAHAGVSASKIRDYDIELDTYRGTKVYEIDFESGRYEYEYKINAQTGKIVFVEKDRD